jgi:hypothetical protein
MKKSTVKKPPKCFVGDDKANPLHLDRCTDNGMFVSGGCISTATSERYKQELGNIARQRLLKYPDCQAEAIAKHYIAHATVALQILKMLECCQSGAYPEIADSVQMLVSVIKNNHWQDFGIELEWPNT